MIYKLEKITKAFSNFLQDSHRATHKNKENMLLLYKTLCEIMNAYTSSGTEEIPPKRFKHNKSQCVICPTSKDSKITMQCIKCDNFT